MLLYLFFDSLLSTCPKKMETENWPKAADSPLNFFFAAVITRRAIWSNTLVSTSLYHIKKFRTN